MPTQPHSPEPEKSKEKKEPMFSAQDKKYLYGIGAVIAAAVLLGFGAWIVHATQENNTQTLASSSPSPTLTPSPSASPTVTPSPSPVVSPSVSPSPTVSPSPSVSPSATPGQNANFPLSAQSFVSGFYAAYQAKNSAEISGMFTADTTSELQSEHSRMFTGIDSTTNLPGGPTLFSTGAPDSVSSFAIQSEVQQGSNWQVTTVEQRLNSSGVADGSETTIMILVPSGSSWLIDSYYYQGETSGKYDAFQLPS